jgi:hypothetical protein
MILSKVREPYLPKVNFKNFSGGIHKLSLDNLMIIFKVRPAEKGDTMKIRHYKLYNDCRKFVSSFVNTAPWVKFTDFHTIIL